MLRRTFTNGPSIRIRVLNPYQGRSLSLTVYHRDLQAVAEVVERAVKSRWRCTSLTDRRHKRRL